MDFADDDGDDEPSNDDDDNIARRMKIHQKMMTF